VSYQSKTSDKIGKAVYQNCILLYEKTASFLIATPKEPSESIAEEITEEQEDE
jgi:hypothetical protein